MVEYPQVKSIPLSRQVCEQIRKMVLSGKLLPGARLNEQEIAKQMEVNRAAVREAFRILGQTGLIKYTPYKGTFITRLSQEDIQELASIRALLEGYAAELSVKHINNDDIRHMETLIKEMDELSREGRRIALVEKDLEFHEFIWKKSGNRFLFEILSNVKTRIQLFFQLYSAFSEKICPDFTHSFELHQDIVDALSKGAPMVAREVLCRHIEYSAKYTVSIMNREDVKSDF